MKISIVTPSFNQAKFIERTINSVINQAGNFELEYIIVDGGSSDGSIDIIKRYAERDHRIKWLAEPDKGQSDAINKGLRLATGDVVTYLNSDDIYLPGALQKVADFFQSHPKTQWAYGRCRIIDESDNEVRPAVTWYKNQLLRRYRYWLLLVVNYISQPATFWRRRLLPEIGYFNPKEHLVMDYEYWLRLEKHHPAGVINKYLACFRIHAAAKSGRWFVQQFQKEYQVAKLFTNNPLLLLLHKLQAYLVILIYHFIH